MQSRDKSLNPYQACPWWLKFWLLCAEASECFLYYCSLMWSADDINVNVGRLIAVHFLMWTWSQVRKLWICGKTCLWNMLQDSLTTYVTLFLLWMSLILWRHVTFLCLITYCHNLLLLLLIQPLLFLCLTIFIFSFFRTWSWLSQVCKSKIPGLFIYLVSVDATIIIFQPVDCIVISFVTSRQTTIELR